MYILVIKNDVVKHSMMTPVIADALAVTVNDGIGLRLILQHLDKDREIEVLIVYLTENDLSK